MMAVTGRVAPRDSTQRMDGAQMDIQTQSRFEHISTMATLALHALETPEGRRDTSALAAALKAIKMQAEQAPSRADSIASPTQAAPFVTVNLASAMTGLSDKAIRRKIGDGKWIEGREYRRSPDGGIFISIAGFVNWVEGRPQGERRRP